MRHFITTIYNVIYVYYQCTRQPRMTCLNVFFGLLYYLGKAGKEGLKGSKHEKRSVGGCCGGDLPKRV